MLRNEASVVAIKKNVTNSSTPVMLNSKCKKKCYLRVPAERALSFSFACWRETRRASNTNDSVKGVQIIYSLLILFCIGAEFFNVSDVLWTGILFFICNQVFITDEGDFDLI